MNPKDNELINVEVGFHAESEKSWAVLVDIHSPTSASRKEWFPKNLCALGRHPVNIYRHIMTAPKWLLIEKKVKLPEEYNDWKKEIKNQLKVASTQNVKIDKDLKKFVKDLLENADSEFQLIYFNSRQSYIDIRFKGEISKQTLAYILRNYGHVVFQKLKQNKRLR